MASNLESKPMSIESHIGEKPSHKTSEIIRSTKCSALPVKIPTDSLSPFARRSLNDVEKENASLKVDLLKFMEDNQKLMLAKENLRKKITKQDYESGLLKNLVSKLNNKVTLLEE